LTVAVNFADRTVNHDTFHVGITRNRAKYSFKNIGFNPMPEALEDGIPVAKLWRKIAPRRASAGDPQNGFHENTAVAPCATGIAFLAKTMWLHQSPLRIGYDKSGAQHSNLHFGRIESERLQNVNPESQQALGPVDI